MGKPPQIPPIMRSENVIFQGGAHQQLAGYVNRPLAGEPRAWALFAHCFTCGGTIKAARTIARALSERGWGVLRIDFTGLGESEGDFGDQALSGDVADLLAGARWLEEHHQAPQAIIGHSLGGAAALLAASRLPSCRAVATIGSPSDPAHVQHLFEDQLEAIRSQGQAQVSLAGRTFRLRRSFLEDLESQSLEGVLSGLKRALLILHAPQDEIVGIDHAARLYTQARHPKSFVSLDGADHLLTRVGDGQYVAEIIAAWASRYLEPASRETEPAAEVVAAIGTDRYPTGIEAGPHRLRADEPASMGGDDSGPDPYGLLLSALGACTAITLRMYADRKKWALERAEVLLDHQKHKATETGEESDHDAITRRIRLSGELDAEQRKRLIAVANRCPVHRTLTENRVTVETQEAES